MLNFIILAGGSGTRLFPLSRENFPKQFIKIGNNSLSLFQQTLKRLLNYISKYSKAANFFISTHEKYKFFIISNLEELQRDTSNPNISFKKHLVFEPMGKNTAPAIALALREAYKVGVPKEDIFFIFPADHIITPQEYFDQTLNEAVRLAEIGYIVTFGIIPHSPETGYGYIEVGEALEKAFKVKSFVEKPSKELAEEYIKKGNYYWNSGMFVFRGDIISQELERYAPEIAKILNISDEELKDYFINSVPNISIDYAVMEKSDRLVLVPAKFQWSDVGSWDSVYEVLKKDDTGVVKIGNVLSLSCKNSLFFANERLLAAVGLEDIILVETPDVILVMRRGDSQKVREVVNKLKENGHSAVEDHLTEFRPWGSFTLLEKGERYKIKRITVKPGEALSLQMHHHRSEHWVVVKGTAKVQIGDKTLYIHENESIFIPKSTLHRLENPGKIPLEIIEVQVGEYVEEDDIVRFGDQYGRS